MSGAGVFAILGKLASIEQLVEVSYKVVKRAVSFYQVTKGLPKALEDVQNVC